MTIDDQTYEKLGLLYLGGELTNDGTTPAARPYLLPSRDLVTHGVIVGMTGSGKTGLGAVLLEEAAIDGIPAIVIDPKGDLGNLLLTFPSLSPESFAPWVPADDDAAAVAERTKKGLAEWNQAPARIGLFERSVERAIYTPGSSAGRKLSIMGGFDRPASVDDGDDEATRARAVSLTSSLLSLAGMDVDPVVSAEHVLVSTVLLHLWNASPKTDLGQLLGHIQNPPFARLGLLETDSVAPPALRQSIAMRLNTAFASPALQGFLQGEPLDVEKLLYTAEGKPRLSVITLAHLDDNLRMFFVTILLNELLSWTRRQPGTSSLRALLYMDEVAGYLPPVKAPPSKAPIMTLLKQARAYGVGCVLATQNPVDVDYKALANAGVWYLGRLQTERDKARVLEGLEGNASATGAPFDKAAVDAALSSLPKRAFYAHNVHSKTATTFTTRYALSYLRGPLMPAEIKRLNAASTTTVMMAAVNIVPPPRPSSSSSSSSASLSSSSSVAPPVPGSVEVRFEGEGVLTPWLWARTSNHYVHAKSGTDTWMTRWLLVPFVDDNPAFDAAVTETEVTWANTKTPSSSTSYAALPPACARDKSWESWGKTVVATVVRAQPLVLLQSIATDVTSKAGESKSAFIQRVAQKARELRDDEVATLTTKWAPKIARAQLAVKKAEEKADALGSKRTAQTVSTGVDIGMSVLGALFGTRRSVTTAAGRAVKSASKHATSGGALDAAKEAVDDATEALAAVQAEAQAAIAEAQAAISSGAAQVTELTIAAKKTDVTVEALGLLWRA